MAKAQTAATPETQKAWRGIVTKAWSDEKFKNKLMDDPNGVLRGAGIELPQGVNFVVVENEASRVHLVLPAKPSGDISVSKLPESDYDPGF